MKLVNLSWPLVSVVPVPLGRQSLLPPRLS